MRFIFLELSLAMEAQSSNSAFGQFHCAPESRNRTQRSHILFAACFQALRGMRGDAVLDGSAIFTESPLAASLRNSNPTALWLRFEGH